ncbi:MAG: hypothetical protein ACJ8G3_08965 [Burkholderiaceae bacterium]
MKETLPVDQATPSPDSGIAYVRSVKNWTTQPKGRFAVNAPIRLQIASSRLSPWRWIPHGYATRPSRQKQDEAKLTQHFSSKKLPSTGRHVHIIAGRAVRDDGSCKVYGYINREVTSAATRLDHFLSEQGTAQDQKITIVSDGAGEI